jgi:hypothetical protein
MSANSTFGSPRPLRRDVDVAGELTRKRGTFEFAGDGSLSRCCQDVHNATDH